MNKLNKAFSLAELMIVMLILTIILAATMPILSKRAKMKAAAAAAPATINLPAVTENGACTNGNIAISSDGTTLLTCQGGVWKRPSIGSAAGQVLYIYGENVTGSTPVSCPTGWTQASYQVYDSSTTWDRIVRSCYNSTQACSVLYIYGENVTGSTPVSCPTGWTQASYQVSNSEPTWDQIIRSCYKCS